MPIVGSEALALEPGVRGAEPGRSRSAAAGAGHGGSLQGFPASGLPEPAWHDVIAPPPPQGAGRRCYGLRGWCRHTLFSAGSWSRAFQVFGLNIVGIAFSADLQMRHKLRN